MVHLLNDIHVASTFGLNPDTGCSENITVTFYHTACQLSLPLKSLNRYVTRGAPWPVSDVLYNDCQTCRAHWDDFNFAMDHLRSRTKEPK
jgi:hypothetical protein